MAHGTGTPQNRVTESAILNETARAFGIEGWPVAAVKYTRWTVTGCCFTVAAAVIIGLKKGAPSQVGNSYNFV